MFTISLFLPALEFLGVIPGWQAAAFAYSHVFDRSANLDGRIFYGSIGLANAMFLVVPLVCWFDEARPALGQAFILAMRFLCTAAVVAVLSMTERCLVGSYLWIASYLVLLIAFPMRRLDATVVMVALLVWATYYYFVEG